jgi:hypothetical protein
MNNTICPYTALPVSQVVLSREHIVPDGLGGPNGFSLKADIEKNSDYGSSIDSWLIRSPLVSVFAARFGVETKSGLSTLFKARGHLIADGSPVDVQLGQASAEFRSRIPVVKNPETGQISGVRGFGSAAEAEVAKISARLAKKGSTVLPGECVELDSTVKIPVTFNQLDVVHGLGKIAYLTTVWVLGDAFIGTEGAATYRKWIDADHTRAALEAVGLHTIPTDGLAAEFAHFSEATHILTCAVVDGQVVTCVRLFNNDLLSFSAVVAIPELPTEPRTIRIIAIDPVNKTFEERNESTHT